MYVLDDGCVVGNNIRPLARELTRLPYDVFTSELYDLNGELVDGVYLGTLSEATVWLALHGKRQEPS